MEKEKHRMVSVYTKKMTNPRRSWKDVAHEAMGRRKLTDETRKTERAEAYD